MLGLLIILCSEWDTQLHHSRMLIEANMRSPLYGASTYLWFWTCARSVHGCFSDIQSFCLSVAVSQSFHNVDKKSVPTIWLLCKLVTGMHRWKHWKHYCNTVLSERWRCLTIACHGNKLCAYWSLRIDIMRKLGWTCLNAKLQADLINMTWHEVQRKLLEAQKELQMCIHKAELTELGTSEHTLHHFLRRFYSLTDVENWLVDFRYWEYNYHVL